MAAVVGLVATTRDASATSCPGACTQTCNRLSNCTMVMCGCSGSSCTAFDGGCSGGGPRFPNPRPAPRPPTAVVSTEIEAASFKDDVLPGFDNWSGWDITVDSAVTDFTVTTSYENTNWISALQDIVTDAGLCYSVNSSTHDIDIENCP